MAVHAGLLQSKGIIQYRATTILWKNGFLMLINDFCPQISIHKIAEHMGFLKLSQRLLGESGLFKATTTL